MKRIVLESPRRFGVRDVPVPEPGHEEALVRIGCVGVCGSDMHLYRMGRIGDIVMSEPMVIGHECTGVVERVGECSPLELVGRRVAVEPASSCGRCEWCTGGRQNLCPEVRFLGLPPVQGALQEYLVHPAHLLEPLPDNVCDAAAVALEPMAIALHAIHLAKIRAGVSVAILGTGVLGTCVLALLALWRGLRIVCVDLMEDRLERAAQLGADVTIRAGGAPREEIAQHVRQAAGGHGADIVFECAGADDTLWNMCEVAAPGGHVALIGTNHEDTVLFSSGTARRKGLTIRMVRRACNTLPTCLRLMQQGLLAPERIVTHTFPASQVGDAFETVDRYADGVLKALVDMQQW